MCCRLQCATCAGVCTRSVNTQVHAPARVCLTVNGLGVVSLRVVEPIRPLLYLHLPAWADPESARRRLSPPRKNLHPVDGGG